MALDQDLPEPGPTLTRTSLDNLCPESEFPHSVHGEDTAETSTNNEDVIVKAGVGSCESRGQRAGVAVSAIRVTIYAVGVAVGGICGDHDGMCKGREREAGSPGKNRERGSLEEVESV